MADLGRLEAEMDLVKVDGAACNAIGWKRLLWSPYVKGQTIIFLPCDFYLLFSSSPNLSGRRLDVYHTSTHGVALVRI